MHTVKNPEEGVAHIFAKIPMGGGEGQCFLDKIARWDPYFGFEAFLLISCFFKLAVGENVQFYTFFPLLCASMIGIPSCYQALLPSANVIALPTLPNDCRTDDVSSFVSVVEDDEDDDDDVANFVTGDRLYSTTNNDPLSSRAIT
jgi:hypothetical protein